MNPEHDAQGALNAGYAYNPLSKMQVVGYRFLDDSSLKGEQKARLAADPDLRKDMNILDDSDVRSQICLKLQDIPCDIQIIFNQYQCQACGVEGDKRLLPVHCHMEKEAKHLGHFVKKHTKEPERYHPSKGHIFEHPEELYSPALNGCFCTKQRPKKYKCCKKEQGEEGCVEEWACCKKVLKIEGCQMRFKCCGMDVGE